MSRADFERELRVLDTPALRDELLALLAQGGVLVRLPFPDAAALVPEDVIEVKLVSIGEEQVLGRQLLAVERVALSSSSSPSGVTVYAVARRTGSASVAADALVWRVTLHKLDTRKFGPLRLDVGEEPTIPDVIAVKRGELEKSIEPARSAEGGSEC